MKERTVLILAVAPVLVIGLAIGFISVLPALLPELPPPRPSCENDWRLCYTTATMVEVNNRVWMIKNECQTEATKLAKFGEPQWPKPSFENFLPNAADGVPIHDDSFKTGIVTLVEPNARFQNGFGVWERTRIYCTVYLTAGIVNVLAR